MTRDPRNEIQDEIQDGIHDDPLDLRQPDRPLPEGLRRSLLAVPAAAKNAAPKDAAPKEGPREEDAAHHLYLYALERADHVAGLADDALLFGLRPATRAVVELLADVFRQERRPRPLPATLRNRLVGLTSRPAVPRWIAEPRWAAAACWLLAFLLTFGTGDVSARLVEAAGESLSRAPAATSRILQPGALLPGPASAADESPVGDVREMKLGVVSSLDRTLDRARRPAGWLASRASAWQARAEALGARTLDEIRRSLSYYETSDVPTPRPHTPRTGPGADDRATEEPSAFEGESP